MAGDIDLITITHNAERAFDQLAEDGPRVVLNSWMSLATDKAAASNARKPGNMPAVTARYFTEDGNEGIFIGPPDIEHYGQDKTGDNRRVAEWTDKGTTDQRPQRWFKKVTSSAKQKAAIGALNRAARKSGFDVNGGL